MQTQIFRTDRFDKFSLVDKHLLVLNVIGCYPCLNLVTKSLETGKSYTGSVSKQILLDQHTTVWKIVDNESPVIS